MAQHFLPKRFRFMFETVSLGKKKFKDAKEPPKAVPFRNWQWKMMTWIAKRSTFQAEDNLFAHVSHKFLKRLPIQPGGLFFLFGRLVGGVKTVKQMRNIFFCWILLRRILMVTRLFELHYCCRFDRTTNKCNITTFEGKIQVMCACIWILSPNDGGRVDLG